MSSKRNNRNSEFKPQGKDSILIQQRTLCKEQSAHPNMERASQKAVIALFLEVFEDTLAECFREDESFGWETERLSLSFHSRRIRMPAHLYPDTSYGDIWGFFIKVQLYLCCAESLHIWGNGSSWNSRKALLITKIMVSDYRSLYDL